MIRTLGAAAAVIALAHGLTWWRLEHGAAALVSTVLTVIVLVIVADRLHRRLSTIDTAIGLLEGFVTRGSVPGLRHDGVAGLAADVIRRADGERARADALASRAILDEATGLPNRLGALDRLEQTAALAERDGIDAFVALVAVDPLLDPSSVGVADTASVADALDAQRRAENLMWIASSTAVATLRLADWCARWSEHELLAVFRTPADHSWIVAERLRAALMTARDDVNDASSDAGQSGIPVSIGVALLRSDLASVVRDAELALATAQREGGNQVRITSPVAVDLSR
jgi:GGDEF domain-containing protein